MGTEAPERIVTSLQICDALIYSCKCLIQEVGKRLQLLAQGGLSLAPCAPQGCG